MMWFSKKNKKVDDRAKVILNSVMASNPLYGVGTTLDPVATASYCVTTVTDRMVQDLYNHEAIFRRVFDLIIGDMFKEGFTIVIDEDTELSEAANKFFSDHTTDEALKRFTLDYLLYGRAFIYLVSDKIKNNHSKANPLLESEEIMRLLNLSPFIVVPSEELDDDVNSVYYMTPNFYNIESPSNTIYKHKIHKSRIVYLSDGLGSSFAKRLYGHFINLIQTPSYLTKAIISHNQPVLQIKDEAALKEKIKGIIMSRGYKECSDGDVYKEAVQYIQDLIKAKMGIFSSYKMFVSVGSEEFSFKSSNLDGYSDLIKLLQEFVSSASGIPISRLFGISVTGLQNNGNTDLVTYYDTIKNKQDTILYKPISIITRLKFNIESDIRIVFEELSKEMLTNKAVILKDVMTALVQGIEASIFDPETVNRILKSYNIETQDNVY